MNQDLLDKINSLQSKYSNTEEPIEFIEFKAQVQSVTGLISVEIGKHFDHEPVSLTFTKSKFKNSSINGFHSQTEIVFTECSFDEIFITSPNPKFTFKDCVVDSMIVLEGSKELVEFIGGSAFSIEIQKSGSYYFSGIEFTNLIFSFAETHVAHGYFVRCNFNLYFERHPRLISSEYQIDDFEFFECTINEIRSSVNLKLGDKTDFIRCDFTYTAPAAEFTYRRFKKEYSEKRHDTLVNQFGALELKCHFNGLNRKGNELEYALANLYNQLNNFGLAPYRPVKYMGYSLLFGFFLILGYTLNVFEAMHDTFLFFLGPFKLLSKTAIYKVDNIFIEAILNLVSTFLWFFLILGVRRKFKIEK